MVYFCQKYHGWRQKYLRMYKKVQIYNSWCLDSSENNTDNVFIKFQDHLEPHVNYWLSRLHLQQIRQKTEETVDNCVARIKLKAKKCGTRDNIEFEQRVIETIIVGVRYESVQRDLLTKSKTLTLQDAVQLGRSYEVSIIQLMGTERCSAQPQHTHGLVHGCDENHHHAVQLLCTNTYQTRSDRGSSMTSLQRPLVLSAFSILLYV